MAITAGVATLLSVTSILAKLSATAVTGATGPVTYQWHRSTVSGFTPSGGTAIAGATALALTDTGLIPNTPYFYKLRAVDTGHSNDTVDYAQVAAVTAAPSFSPNQFAQTTTVGVCDLRLNVNTIAVEIDASQATALQPGSAVKVVDSAGGIPKVVGCAADSDEVAGFLDYNIKNKSFKALDVASISMWGNCMWLYATAPIARFEQVQLDLTSPASVGPATTSSGACLVGFAVDKAVAYGDLIRVMVRTPSYARA